MKKIMCFESVTHDKKIFLKRIGQCGFIFFLVKGVLWLIISFSVIWFGVN